MQVAADVLDQDGNRILRFIGLVMDLGFAELGEGIFGKGFVLLKLLFDNSQKFVAR